MEKCSQKYVTALINHSIFQGNLSLPWPIGFRAFGDLLRCCWTVIKSVVQSGEQIFLAHIVPIACGNYLWDIIFSDILRLCFSFLRRNWNSITIKTHSHVHFATSPRNTHQINIPRLLNTKNHEPKLGFPGPIFFSWNKNVNTFLYRPKNSFKSSKRN